MTTNGTVISIDGECATVRVARMSACDSCHKGAEGCTICTLSGAKKTMDVKVKNTLSAAIGDEVSLNANSGRVLLYAVLVFILPIALALVLYFTALRLFGDGSPLVFVFSVCGFALSFLFLFLVLGRRGRVNTDITMGCIISRGDLPRGE